MSLTSQSESNEPRSLIENFNFWDWNLKVFSLSILFLYRWIMALFGIFAIYYKKWWVCCKKLKRQQESSNKILTFCLHIDNEYNIVHECGGSIISENQVLTAAWCFINDRKDPSDWIVVQGIKYRFTKQIALNSVDPEKLFLEEDPTFVVCTLNSRQCTTYYMESAFFVL